MAHDISIWGHEAMSGECDDCGEHCLECRCTPEDVEKSKKRNLQLYFNDFLGDKISLDDLKKIVEDY